MRLSNSLGPLARESPCIRNGSECVNMDVRAETKMRIARRMGMSDNRRLEIRDPTVISK
jgi:hypothetical protein